MNRLLILAILIIGSWPVYAQDQQPNAAELAQNVVSIISGDKAKIQTYCQILDLSDELDQADQQKDREKAEALSQKINELQKNLAPNTWRCSRPLSTWIQIPKTVRRSCRTSLSSIIPAGNGDVPIRGLTIQPHGLQPPQDGGSAPRRRGEGSRCPSRDRCSSARGRRAPDRRLERAPGHQRTHDLFAHDRRRHHRALLVFMGSLPGLPHHECDRPADT